MATFIEYFQYPFFVRALAIGGLLGLILSWMSSYVVLRQEVIFTHSLANMGFLGIAVAILFDLPITLSLIVSCLLAAFLINFVQRKKLFNNDSLLEIFAQMGLAMAIIVIAFFPGYRVNIEHFLFGDILGISRFDLWISLVLLLLIGLIVIFCHKTFLKISLSDQLSHTLIPHKKLWHGLLITILALMIALAMKIIGVLLVAAFITIPSNTAKLFAGSIRQTFIFSSFIGLIGVFVGLYFSIILNLPSGAAIVMVLLIFWILAIIGRKIFIRA